MTGRFGAGVWAACGAVYEVGRGDGESVVGGVSSALEQGCRQDDTDEQGQ